ncbi:SGS-domain-containing protein [Pisolithus orientalis]|uniref:SGS-domain-containing protein n=1 Tax=Pisolithus orientalis TaxID=936130 RepID=UPI002224F168|nr:SGS-domain-containing protein [Pisolithus orientalis]KAI6008211.1 SGS-domain-containing protein [Pisolithus orientalis]
MLARRVHSRVFTHWNFLEISDRGLCTLAFYNDLLPFNSAIAMSLRHEFYETDEALTIAIFDRGADPEQVSVKLEPRKLTYQNGDKVLTLQPLKGQIDPDKRDFVVGKMKVEIRLSKATYGRWGALIGDAPDILANYTIPPTPSVTGTSKRKNWEGITTEILDSEKEKDSQEDPNVGGDAAVNAFFQKIFADADDDTRRAMMKSFQESGGTTLSTNWDEVKKEKVEVKPPAGAEWKKWN